MHSVFDLYGSNSAYIERPGFFGCNSGLNLVELVFDVVLLDLLEDSLIQSRNLIELKALSAQTRILLDFNHLLS